MTCHNVDLWHGELTETQTCSDRYLSCLDTNELARAESYSKPLLKWRYIEARGRLKCLLADYLDTSPNSVQIAQTEHGKPYLPNHPPLVFNVSHTANQLVIAVAGHCQLGVDIERIQPRPTLAALVKKCFSTSEAVYWQNLPESEKALVFYQFWTKKEAFVKATGRGIALGLQHCEVDTPDAERFVRVPESCGTAAQWWLATLAIDELFCVSVVTDTGTAELYYRLLP
jgi:4'-phosphopantetheinyl transferase